VTNTITVSVVNDGHDVKPGLCAVMDAGLKTLNASGLAQQSGAP
jgi:hypothetical protein